MQACGLKLVSTGYQGLGWGRIRTTQLRRDLEKPLGTICCTSSPSDSSSSSSGTDGRKGESIPPGSNPFHSRAETYALLKKQLAIAATFENYEEAARIRDSIRSFVDEQPALRLRRLMKEAVEGERFQDAARYRDELVSLAPYYHLKCSSDATTWGIRVQTRSEYVERRSQPYKEHYYFSYQVKIINNSDHRVQLLRSHWIIHDVRGKYEDFWGIGITGEQPIILPGTAFECSSACPLCTPSGRMEGAFEMKHIGKLGSSPFNVTIAPFSLTILTDDDDATI